MRRPIKHNKEVRRRIRVSVAAYAYEFENDSIMSDAEFDELALSVCPELDTGNEKLDEFFRTEFDPATGQWVHKHPELEGLRTVYNMIWGRAEAAELDEIEALL